MAPDGAQVTGARRAGWLALDWAAVGLAVLVVLPLVLSPRQPLNVISNFWPQLSLPLLVFALASLRRRPVLAAACGLAAALVLGTCVRALSPIGLAGAPQAPLAQAQPLKVITFNVLNDNGASFADILDFLIAQDADFAFLEEARGIVRAAGGIEGVGRRLGSHYPYRSGCEPGKKCSLLLLSKHPLLAVRRPNVSPGYHRFVIAETRVRGRALTLVGVHLAKPLQGGLQKRQAALVGNNIRALPRPLVLAGDFNATPWSVTFRRFLRRAGLSYSYGYQPTWPAWLPWLGLPIDHVVVDGLSVIDVHAWPDALGSNHLPLIALVTMP